MRKELDEDRLATPADAMREYAVNVGREHPDWAWVLTDYDVWVRNPHYVGPPRLDPESEGWMMSKGATQAEVLAAAAHEASWGKTTRAPDLDDADIPF